MIPKRSFNLCSVYLLPLIGLNRFSFGSDATFVNSYLTEDNDHIVVEVRNLLIDPSVHEYYKFDYVSARQTVFIVYEFPAKYTNVAELFRIGKFSHFPEEVKNIIRKKSGLTWCIPVQGGKTVSACELLALQRDPVLKAKLEELLNVKLADDAELVSIANQDNFIKLQVKEVQQS